ncbi:1988_t:CDS:2, partial [Racocetra persica]
AQTNKKTIKPKTKPRKVIAKTITRKKKTIKKLPTSCRVGWCKDEEKLN